MRSVSDFIGNLSIRFKISLFSVALVVVTCGAIATNMYVSNAKNIHETALKFLESSTINRKMLLENYLQNIRSNLITFAENPTVIQATKDFKEAWDQLPSGEQTEYLQRAYIEDNPHPLGQKDLLDKGGVEYYDTLHEEFHPWFRLFLKEYGYYDVFLFDLSGNLIYSVFKENDYATNLMTDTWKDTDLGNAFRAGLESNQKRSIHFFDFKPYGPSYDAPASFISTPIYEGSRKIGVAAFQMPIDKINKIMNQRSKLLGKSGEVLITGKDRLLRSDSLFSEENDILSMRIDSPVIDQAVDGETVFGQSSDYRNAELEIAATALEFVNTIWVIVAVKETREITQLQDTLLWQILIKTSIWTILVVVISLYFSYSLTKPLGKITHVMGGLAQGKTDVQLNRNNRKDEIGALWRVAMVLRDNIIERISFEGKVKKEQQARAETEKKNQEVKENVQSFEKDVEERLTSVRGDMDQMEETAKILADGAAQRKIIVTKVAEQAQENSSSTQAVASAAEELSSSIAEIKEQISQVSTDIATATKNAQAANDQVSNLDQAAQNIGNVTVLIQDIAEQTNLLALNATIEAARAGDAGKGFAVVASEVKDLASQTATATENISSQIASIQGSTTTAVDVIKGISKAMGEISGYIAAIQTSVEAQDTSTKDISSSIQKIASGTKSVLDSMQKNLSALEQASQSADQVGTASKHVTGQVSVLNQEITSFIKQVKDVV